VDPEATGPLRPELHLESRLALEPPRPVLSPMQSLAVCLALLLPQDLLLYVLFSLNMLALNYKLIDVTGLVKKMRLGSRYSVVFVTLLRKFLG